MQENNNNIWPPAPNAKAPERPAARPKVSLWDAALGLPCGFILYWLADICQVLFRERFTGWPTRPPHYYETGRLDPGEVLYFGLLTLSVLPLFLPLRTWRPVMAYSLLVGCVLAFLSWMVLAPGVD